MPSSRVLDSDIKWDVEQTSKRGQTYRTGVRSGGQEPNTPLQNNPNCIDVDWKVTNDWVVTSNAVNDTVGISAYDLQDNGIIIIYRLSIITRFNHGRYAFTDATGDEYSLKIFMSGEHHFDYNSANPTIVRVCYYADQE